ncbi:MAG: DUF2238 domain-containing protein [Nevskiales bacterium]
MRAQLPVALLAATLVGLILSGIGPRDRLTWWMEVAPVLIAVPILLATYRSFRFTDLAYLCMAMHAAILMLGGHYTYAETPLGFWLQDLLDLSRNPYDRIGHLAQGFFPALIAREILLRLSPLREGRWLFFLVVCACLALSASYELIEWTAAMALGQGAEQFLGTQGDVWDTQWDMFLALIGAVSSLLLLSGLHRRVLGKLRKV